MAGTAKKRKIVLAIVRTCAKIVLTMSTNAKDPLVFLTARIPASLLKKLKKYVEERGLKVQWFVREAITKEMEKTK
jgi:predicted DNA binding CopG/RHH family protein